MNLQEIISSPLVQRLGWTLLHSLWQVTAVAALALLAMLLLRKRSPQARYLATCGAMALALALAVGTFASGVGVPRGADVPSASGVGVSPASSAGVSPAPKTGTDPTFARGQTGAVKQDGPASTEGPAKMGSVPAFAHLAGVSTALPAETWPGQAARLLEPYLPWSVAAWMLGMAVLALWRLGGWIAAVRLRVIGTRRVSPDIEALVRRLAERMGLRGAVAVLQSLVAQTPMVIGWLRPVVLLPAAALTGLTPTQLEAILAHELAHIRRHDYLLNLLQTAAETLLFYHPAVWWLSHRMRLERERCCDDIAVAVCGDRIGYVEALAAVEQTRLAAHLSSGSRASDPAAAAGQRPAASGEGVPPLRGEGILPARSAGVSPALPNRRSPRALASRLGDGPDLLARIRRILGLSGPASPRSAVLSAAIALTLVAAMIVIPLACSLGSPKPPATPPATQAVEGITIAHRLPSDHSVFMLFAMGNEVKMDTSHTEQTTEMLWKLTAEFEGRTPKSLRVRLASQRVTTLDKLTGLTTVNGPGTANTGRPPPHWDEHFTALRQDEITCELDERFRVGKMEVPDSIVDALARRNPGEAVTPEMRRQAREGLVLNLRLYLNLAHLTLPPGLVKPGQEWRAKQDYAEDGDGETATCKLVSVEQQPGRRIALISLNGQIETISGAEKGKKLSTLTGQARYDLDAQRLMRYERQTDAATDSPYRRHTVRLSFTDAPPAGWLDAATQPATRASDLTREEADDVAADLARIIWPQARPKDRNWWTEGTRDPYTGRWFFRRLTGRDGIELEVSFDARGSAQQARSGVKEIADRIAQVRLPAPGSQPATAPATQPATATAPIAEMDETAFLAATERALAKVQKLLKDDADLGPLAAAEVESTTGAGGHGVRGLSAQTVQKWDFPIKGGPTPTRREAGRMGITAWAVSDPDALGNAPYMPPPGCWVGRTVLDVPGGKPPIIVSTATGDAKAHRRLVETLAKALAEEGVILKAQRAESLDSFGGRPAPAPAASEAKWIELVRSAVPKGWSLKPDPRGPGENGIISRDRPIGVTYSSPIAPGPVDETLEITLIAGPKVSPIEYASLVEFNKALEEKFKGNDATLRRMAPWPWWDKRTAGSEYRPYLLPTHFGEERSLSITCRQLAGQREFNVKEDREEAFRVFAAIKGLFTARTGIATQPTSVFADDVKILHDEQIGKWYYKLYLDRASSKSRWTVGELSFDGNPIAAKGNGPFMWTPWGKLIFYERGAWKRGWLSPYIESPAPEGKEIASPDNALSGLVRQRREALITAADPFSLNVDCATVGRLPGRAYLSVSWQRPATSPVGLSEGQMKAWHVRLTTKEQAVNLINNLAAEGLLARALDVKQNAIAVGISPCEMSFGDGKETRLYLYLAADAGTTEMLRRLTENLATNEKDKQKIEAFLGELAKSVAGQAGTRPASRPPPIALPPAGVSTEPLEWDGRAREMARREQTARNLRDVARAISAYSNELSEPFPILSLPATAPAMQPASAPGTQAVDADVRQKKLIALVEDFFKHNYRDITDRKTIEWGQVTENAGGNLTIRYKYLATIWGKDKLVIEELFTFEPDGEFVAVKDLGKTPASGPATGPVGTGDFPGTPSWRKNE